MGATPRNYYPFAGEMLTVKQICDRTGMEWSTVNTRIRDGTPLDAPYKGYPARYTLNGSVARTICEWATYWNITNKNARLRIDYYRGTGRAEKVTDAPPTAPNPAGSPPGQV